MAERKRPKADRPREPKTIGVRCTTEWSEWVEALAERYRTTIAGVIDRALTEWAESERYEIKPPRRTP